VHKIQTALRQQSESLKTASESTAGDKHNTARAMMHIEEEKLGKQLAQLIKLKKLLVKVHPSKTSNAITLGSLVNTNRGWLYIAVPLGKFSMDGIDLMAISLASPIGQALQGKKVFETTTFNGQNWEVLEII
jgi:transcription elongation GreA/GreB family factor